MRLPLVVTVCVNLTLQVLAQAPEKEKLDPKIRRANPATYRHVRDAKDWRNPFVVVIPDGVWLTCQGAGIPRRKVQVEKLADELVALPVSAWPYGRIVALQEASVRGGEADDVRIERNLAEARRILEALHIKVNMWPR